MKVIDQVKNLLRQGRKPTQLIEFGFSKAAVTRARRQLRQEKAGLGPQVPERATFTKSKTMQAQDKTSDIQQKPEPVASNVHKGDDLEKVPPELLSLMAAAKKIGIEKRECCPHEEDDICDQYQWSTRDEIPQYMGEPVCTGDKIWQMKPSCYFCVLCTALLFDLWLD